MFRRWIALSLSFIALFQVVRPDEPTNYFIEPGPQGEEGDYTDNKAYTGFQEVYLEWNTDFPSINLAMRQEGAPDSVPVRDIVFMNGRSGGTPYNGSYIWKVYLGDYDIEKYGPVFTLIGRALDSSKRSFVSDYFNISRPPDPFAKPTSSSSIASSPTPATPDPTSPTFSLTISSSVASTNITETSSTTSETPSPTSDATSTGPPPVPANPKMTTGAKIGIGVGVSVGTIGFVMSALGLYCMRRSQKRTPELKISAPIQNDYGSPQVKQYAYRDPVGGHGYTYRGQKPVELDTGGAPQELPGENFKMLRELPGEPLRTPQELEGENLKTPREMPADNLK